MMTDIERAALERLVSHALRDTGQSRRVADFLLAWWNARDCGGFDLTDLWGVDDEIAADMVTVVTYLAKGIKQYPDELGFKQQFEAIVREWRPK
jgi:hypothetical protein